MSFVSVIDGVAIAVDACGVLAVVVGIVVAAVRAISAIRRGQPSYHSFRQGLGRAILLGLELLVAADIIRTVAVTPTMQSVLVLGVIVLIRTALSFSLEVELEGRWPWQRATTDGRPQV